MRRIAGGWLVGRDLDTWGFLAVAVLLLLQPVNALLRVGNSLFTEDSQHTQTPQPAEPPLFILESLCGIYAITVSTHQ